MVECAGGLKSDRSAWPVGSTSPADAEVIREGNDADQPHAAATEACYAEAALAATSREASPASIVRIVRSNVA